MLTQLQKIFCPLPLSPYHFSPFFPLPSTFLDPHFPYSVFLVLCLPFTHFLSSFLSRLSLVHSSRLRGLLEWHYFLPPPPLPAPFPGQVCLPWGAWDQTWRLEKKGGHALWRKGRLQIPPGCGTRQGTLGYMCVSWCSLDESVASSPPADTYPLKLPFERSGCYRFFQTASGNKTPLLYVCFMA